MNHLYQWAHRHKIPSTAVSELVQLLTGMNTDPQPMQGTSEAAVQAAIRLEASQKGLRLWRNNVGSLMDERGVPVRYGLANETAAMNKAIKSSDLIGIRPVRIEPSHVGTVIGQFVAREVKAVGWSYRGNKHEQAQLKFLELVAAMGGDAQFANCVGSL